MLTPIVVVLVEGLATGSVGAALEWLFFSTLSTFCFGKALQDLQLKHQQSSICTGLDDVDRAMFCEMIDRTNQTSACCPGKLPDSSVCHFTHNIRLSISLIACIYVKQHLLFHDLAICLYIRRSKVSVRT